MNEHGRSRFEGRGLALSEQQGRARDYGLCRLTITRNKSLESSRKSTPIERVVLTAHLSKIEQTCDRGGHRGGVGLAATELALPILGTGSSNRRDAET